MTLLRLQCGNKNFTFGCRIKKLKISVTEIVNIRNWKFKKTTLNIITLLLCLMLEVLWYVMTVHPVWLSIYSLSNWTSLATRQIIALINVLNVQKLLKPTNIQTSNSLLSCALFLVVALIHENNINPINFFYCRCCCLKSVYIWQDLLRFYMLPAKSIYGIRLGLSGNSRRQ